MKTKENTITVSRPRDGLKQFTFSHHGYKLSVGFGANHYASWMVGERFGPEGSQHFPTTYEVAVLDEDDNFLPLTSMDQVAGWQSPDVVEALIQKMSRDDFDHKDLKFYCD